MSENRLADYLHHMQQAAAEACSFVQGLSRDEFLVDKRTQRAVIIESHHRRRGGDEVDGRVCRVCRVASGGAMAQHAGHAQSHRSRLLRHQPRCGVGNSADGASGADQATGFVAEGCRRGIEEEGKRARSMPHGRLLFSSIPRRTQMRRLRWRSPAAPHVASAPSLPRLACCSR